MPPPAIFTAKNTGGQKIFIAVAVQIPENERSSAVRNMAGAAKSASKEKGWKISSEKQTTASGLTFETFRSEMPDGTTVLNWMTLAGSEAYSLQAISKVSDASTDPELQSLLASFRLISAVPANTPGLDKSSVSYKAGRVFGCCLVAGVFVAIVAGPIIWLVRRNKRKG